MTSQAQTIRMVMLGFLISCAYGLITCKILWLQIYEAPALTEMATRQYEGIMTLVPERAHIYDRHGNALTCTRDHVSAFVVPYEIEQLTAWETWLSEHAPSALERLKKQPKAQFCFIKRNLSDTEYAAWSAHAPPELRFIRETGRSYVLPSAGPIVGITDIDNKGLFGIERIHNERLQGAPQRYRLKRDARARHLFFFERIVTDRGEQGKPVHLTLDSTLQFMAAEEVQKAVNTFQAKAGAALIIDPHTGDILACVQVPTFDPNDRERIDILHTPAWPFTHAFELGSVIKIFLALAALSENIVTLDTEINCYNTKHIALAGMRLNTVRAHGIISFREVIAQSNNIGTAQVALLLGEKIYAHYLACGFNAQTDLHWPAESPGYVTNPQHWSRQSFASLSYGYEIRATLLQLACAYALITRSGTPLSPRLVLDPVTPTHTHAPRYTSTATHDLHTILEHTVTAGTARNAALKGYHVCGKTGSAFLLENGAYQPDKNIFTFVGHVKLNGYERIIVTCIREPTSAKLFASQTTAPLFEKIAERMVIYEDHLLQAP